MKTVLYLFLAVVVVHIESARHHKIHRSHDDREGSTEPSVTESGSTWPNPSSIGNFQVPNAFVNDVITEDEQQSSGRKHSRRSHKH